MMAAYPPVPQASGPASRVELRISCKNLIIADFGLSDPMVVVYTYDQHGARTEYARTEVIVDNQNPQFLKSIEMTYYFEMVQKLRFVVYDIDNDTPSLDDDDYLGNIECTLGEIVSACSFTKPLQHEDKKYEKRDKGTMTIRAEEVSSNKEMLELRFSAQGLDKKDFLGKSDPYLEFARQNPDGSYTLVHKIPYILNTLNPRWPPFKLESSTLCGSDESRSIRVQCFDWDEATDPDLIGEFYTSLAEMKQVGEGKKMEWEAINPGKKKKKKYKNSGTISLDTFQSTRIYSFLDYIMGGCQINFTVGVDFTASNGEPSDPKSLHYINPIQPNEYTHALWAVGGVCQDYDTDKQFPAFGFGGNIGGKVSHEFPLNGNWENPYCAGIQGVVQAYHQSLQTVELFGPTNVAPIINHVAKFAAEAAKQGTSTQNYFVLLLLTDGVLSDMMQTKLALINASRLPMSVIIVGVGQANFSAMDELDSDDKLLKVGGAKAERDICQFVPFRKYVAQGPAAMASAVLAEIPSQVSEYFNNKRIPPLNVPQQ